MNSHITSSRLVLLEPNDSSRLAKLCGQFNEHLKQIEKHTGVRISNRGNSFKLRAQNKSALSQVADLLYQLYEHTADLAFEPCPESLHLLLQELQMTSDNDEAQEDYNEEPTSQNPLSNHHLKQVASMDSELKKDDQHTSEANKSTEVKKRNSIVIKAQRISVETRGPNQKHYIEHMLENDINFGIGPAGTGKTYLAVACAVAALQQEEVDRIILVRPAVEAGEKLGFLPGDLSDKVNPYLRPLYDALYEMLGFEKVEKYIERNIIEVAPLAYMRGRTLNNSFIILDESQNTTREQMKMFLTRIGFGSRAVITGDITQVDLPKGTDSGLVHAKHVLENTDGIGFTHFSSRDVVRHSLVQRIIEAYDTHESNTKVEPIKSRPRSQ